ncbi:xylulokinase [Aquipuribacter sp. SD81]|uniref:xylulokinase n=1 Tax=Aquipuribacter sp. SD81 TaxID=3127703 RepID=UPI003016E77C
MAGTDGRVLVAGVDSSTQACKVVVRDAATGALVRFGRAPHPDGTEVHPDRWWDALRQAVSAAGGLDDVSAVSVGAQQHGMVALDEAGEVVRPALLWNDTRSAGAARDLVEERGREAWAEATGVVPVASFTVTKLRWLRDHEPDAAARVAAVCLPHDWLTWRLLGHGPGAGAALDALTTDRGDASGTGYWSPADGGYRADLLEAGLGHDAVVPRVVEPGARAGEVADGADGTPLARGTVLGAGTGDNAAAALGLQVEPGDVVLSVGTSGVASVVSDVAAADPSGIVAGFADATGRYLPLVCTLNAARVLDATARLLGVDHDRLSELALSAPPGADGLVLVPYLEGERTPDLPDATGSLHGMTLASTTPAHLARAAVEGVVCGLAAGVDALLAHGGTLKRVVLVGGGAASPAVQQVASAVLGCPVVVPEPSEYVADGAARQAAWALSGEPEPPTWTLARSRTVEVDATPHVRDRYAEAAGHVLDRVRTD